MSRSEASTLHTGARSTSTATTAPTTPHASSRMWTLLLGHLRERGGAAGDDAVALPHRDLPFPMV